MTATSRFMKRTPREKPNASITAMRYDVDDTPLCRQCGQRVPPWRETFCTQECVDRWRCETDAGFFRAEVLSDLSSIMWTVKA